MFFAQCAATISGLILISSIYITLLIRTNFTTKKIDDLYSSVNCHGRTIGERRCKFRNLCFRVDSEEFVFIRDRRSLIVNLPDDRFQPSLQYLGSVEHNNYYFNYVEVDYSSLKNVLSNHRFVRIENPTFIYARFKPDNLMHNLHDDLLPLYHTLTLFSERKSGATKEPIVFDKANLFLFDNYAHIDQDYFAKTFFSAIFNNLELFYKTDFKEKNQVICFEDVEIGLEKSTVWYDYGFKNFQKSINKTANEKHLIRLLTNEIMKYLLKFHGSGDRTCDKFYTTLISRRRSRLILNEDQLIEQLESSFGYNVQRIDIDYDSEISDALIKITCSKVMIGMHGAGLILSMFLPEHANLIELFPYKINASNYTPYKQLANIYNLNYFTWTNSLSANSFYNLEYLREEIKDRIHDNVEVEPSLCCDEPYFLFRIYQDTIVDIGQIGELFLKVKRSAVNIAERDFKIPPSKLSINCSRTDKKMSLNWTKPWNLINLNDVEYEVLISHQQKSIRYRTKDNQLVVNVGEIEDSQQILIWIRAVYNQVQGPFDDKPLYC